MLVTSNQEKQYLLELLHSAHTALLHQLHRVDSMSFRQQLKQTIHLNEVLPQHLEDLDEPETDYLVELLTAAHTELMHQIHRADAFEFRQQLREVILVNELLREKLEPVAV
ncbi:MAG: hypothetical protein ACYC7A_22225 [Thermoanaerobaculia bacterium]